MAAFPYTGTVPIAGQIIICDANVKPGQPGEAGVYLVLGVTATGFQVARLDSGGNPMVPIGGQGAPMTMPQSRILCVVSTS